MATIQQASLEQRFRLLASEWKQATSHLSSVTDRSMHLAYQQIIGLGPDAVSLILRELERETDDWFWALAAITGENPIPRGAEGKLSEMRAAWVQWGTEHGYL
jgi:hypothetical protein